MIKVVSELIWLWVVIESENKKILSFYISKGRNMFVVAKRFLSLAVNMYGKHQVSSDSDGTWYPPDKFLNLHHHIYSNFEKSIIERTMQYIKNRTESFDDYFLCRKKNKYKLKHIKQCFKLFVYQHNEIIS